MDSDALWRHRLAHAIHQIEKPAAMELVRRSDTFQKGAMKAVKLHREIMVLSGEACSKSQCIAIVGFWTAQDKGKISVVGMPSLQRYPDIEAQLASLGKLLAFG